MRPIYYVITLTRNGPEGKFIRGVEDQTGAEFSELWHEDPSILSIHELVLIPPKKPS